MLSEKENTIKLSRLGHTWIFDLDGTIVKHNGYKIDGYDTLLEGAKEFLEQIPEKDMIIFLTSRTDEVMQQTKMFLHNNEIRYDIIINNAPYGERILVNDMKPSGLITALAFNSSRDKFFNTIFEEEKEL